MFRGITKVNMDAKGRFALPTRYRDRIAETCENRLVITVDTEDRCLLIYPLSEWVLIEQDLEKLPRNHPAVKRILRLVRGFASDVEMDAQGRVLVSQELREYAGLGKKLVLMGQGKKFELWDEAAWKAKEAAYLEGEDAELPEDLLNSLPL
ncbi:MAG: transcriptional regulator MraZ [Gammaproteobacteria bacterium]|nr:MAG: transcriptional regulator MraZ [Gammaproteobacteria bacterium]